MTNTADLEEAVRVKVAARIIPFFLNKMVRSIQQDEVNEKCSFIKKQATYFIGRAVYPDGYNGEYVDRNGLSSNHEYKKLKRQLIRAFYKAEMKKINDAEFGNTDSLG